MIVVSDTSPLNYLVLLQIEDVLPKLFGEVYVPPSLLTELKHLESPNMVRQWASACPNWLRVQAPMFDSPVLDLDRGEAEAIRLSLELQADRLLIDDRKGRRVAAQHAVSTVGTLTLLETAAARGAASLPDLIEQLRHTNFRASRVILDAALRRDAIRRQSSA